MLHTPRPYLGQAETPVPPVGRASLPDQNVFIMFGGNVGMPGAVNIAAQAALRIGAGAVTVATRPYYAENSLANLPKLFFQKTSLLMVSSTT